MMATPQKQRIFTSGQKRSSLDHSDDRPRRLSKRLKRIYDFSYDETERDDVGVDDLSSDESFEDSGLPDDSLSLSEDQEPVAPKNWKPLLNKSVTPKRTYSRSSPDRSRLRGLNIFTSTPIKPVHRIRRSSLGSPLYSSEKEQEKVDLWEQAMNNDPNLRSFIEKFNEELQAIEHVQLCVETEAEAEERKKREAKEQ